MAAEQDLKLDGGGNGGDAAAPAGGGKKKLIIIILAILLIVAAAVGATLFFLSGDDSEEEAAEEGEAAAEIVEEPGIPAQYVILKPEFVISFQTPSRQRFLQVSIEVMTRSQTVVDALNFHEPMIRSNIIRIIGEQNFDALRTPEGRIALQDQLTEHVNQLIKRESGVDGVEAVLFTDFVMQ